MANTVNFKIRLDVDGQQQVVNATADISNLSKETAAAEKAANRFTRAFSDMANVSMALDGLTNTIGQMQRSLQELSNVLECTTKPVIYDGDTGGKTEHIR